MCARLSLIVAFCCSVVTIVPATSSPDRGCASARASIADLYHEGRHDEAKDLALNALATAERTLGASHLDISGLLADLAMIYDSQGEYAAAGSLHTRAVLIQGMTLGPMHPEVGRSLATLAAVRRSQGRYEDADSLYTEALVVLESSLGPDHAYVASALNGLAVLRCFQEEPAMAEALYTRALKILERTRASGPEVGMVLQNLAVLYGSIGEDSLAAMCWERVRGIVEGH